MKKRNEVAIAIVAMLLTVMFFVLANFAVAADDVNIGIDNKNNINATGGNATASSNQQQNQQQQQQQNQQQKITNNNLGAMPVAPLITPGLPGNQTGNYGKSAQESALSGSAIIFCGITGRNVRDMIEINDHEEGTTSWSDIKADFKSMPLISNRRPALSDSDKIYMLSGGERAYQLLRSSNGSQLVGGWVFTTKNDKDDPVIPAHLQMQAQLKAIEYGANVVVAFDQYDSRFFTPNSFDVSIGGVMSWISKCFTGGQSISGSAVIAAGQTTAHVSPGAGFIFLRVEMTDGLCGEQRQVVVENQTCNPSEFIAQINAYENEIGWCKFPCYNNQKLRFGKGNAYLNEYFCEGRKNKQLLLNAIYEFGVAERDYINGH